MKLRKRVDKEVEKERAVSFDDVEGRTAFDGILKLPQHRWWFRLNFILKNVKSRSIYVPYIVYGHQIRLQTSNYFISHWLIL